jgi:hypothetical protein
MRCDTNIESCKIHGEINYELSRICERLEKIEVSNQQVKTLMGSIKLTFNMIKYSATTLAALFSIYYTTQ